MASEPIDQLAVRLVADGEGFLDDVDENVESAKEKLEELPRAAQEAADAMSDDLRQAALDMIATTEQLGISLEEAADLLSDMAMGAGFSAEELLRAAEIMDQQGLAIIESGIQRIVSAAEDAGLELSQNQVENYRQFFQTIVTEARRVETEGPIAIERALDRIVEAGEEAGAKFSAQQKQVFEDYLEDVNEIGDHIPPATAAIDSFTSGIEQQIQAMSGGSGVVQAFTSQMGALFQRLLGGLTILALFNKGVQALRKGIADATAMAEAQFRLAVAVRAQQRAFGESAGTIQEWQTFARDIAKEFGRPMERTMVDVAASVQLMTQNMDLNNDQMRDLLRTGTALANMTGNELEPTMRRLVRFMQTGYTQGLTDLSVNLTEADLQQAAFSLNIRKSLDELTDAEAQLVRYTALMEQTSFALDDASARTGTLIGRLDQANQKTQEASELLGRVFLPTWVRIKETLADAALAVSQIITLFRILQIAIRGNLVAALAGGAAAFQEFWQQMRPGGEGFDPEQIFAAFDDEFIRTRTENIEGHLDELFNRMDGLGDLTEEEMDQAANAFGDLAAAVPQASAAIEDAMQRWEVGVAKAQQKLSDRLEDIEQDFRDRLFDIQLDLQRDLADIDRQAARDRMETLRDHQVEEMRAREDHARRVAELERQYLFDLEDAVRERDARAVLDLQRRFRAERQELDDEFELRQKRRKEDLQLELQDIENRRRIRREERIRAFEQELEDLHRMRERRRADAQRNFQRQLRDLRRNIERRLRLVADGMSQELRLTHQGLQELYKMLNDAYGPNGWVEAFYARYSAIVSGSGGGGGVVGPGGSTRIEMRQRGGRLMATSPTLLAVGEGRPEQVDITPLSASTGQPSAGFRGGGMGGRAIIEVKVDASDRLIIETADFVENEIADIFVDVNQGQRQSQGALR